MAAPPGRVLAFTEALGFGRIQNLLNPPAQRPAAFVRASDTLDPARGGFVAPPCVPPSAPTDPFCYDTTKAGNGNGGHLYGVDLPADQKSDLLAYLLTF